MIAPRSPEALRAAARRRLPLMIADYIDGSSGTEDTDRRNQSDLRAIALPQRVMRAIPAAHFATDLAGTRSRLPIVLGPVGMAGMFARRGEVSAALAAKAAGVPFCLSMMSVCAIDELVEAGTGPFWFQLYMLRDRGFIAALLQQAATAGCSALIVTVDLPMPGMRYRDFKSGLAAPSGRRGQIARGWHAARRPAWTWDVGFRGAPHTLGNLAAVMPAGKALGGLVEWIGRNYDPQVTWRDLDFIRAHWRGPIIVKGILHPADALHAAEAGVDAVVVSNHGGRQLDGALSTTVALPPIVAALRRAGSNLPIYVDGGAYTGSDVVRFLSLGATSVWLGRAWAHALAAAGQAGVAMLLRRIETEIGLAAGFSGLLEDVRGES